LDILLNHIEIWIKNREWRKSLPPNKLTTSRWTFIPTLDKNLRPLWHWLSWQQ